MTDFIQYIKARSIRSSFFILANQFRSLIGSRFAKIALAGHANAAGEEMQGLVQGVLEPAEKASVKNPALNSLIRYI